MKILLFGGTRFLGRHLVDALLAGGHSVTLFHRGRSNPGLFPEATHVLGDRRVGLDALVGTWDVAVDVCGYLPSEVRRAADLLKDRVKQYVFVSTISVYDPSGQVEIDEQSPLLEPLFEDQEITSEAYGRLKVGCEQFAQEAFGPRLTTIRPGLMVGPYDPTRRFTEWINRFQAGGEINVPDVPNQPVQLLDGRDLAQFTVNAAENGLTGIFDTAGSASNLGQMIKTISDATGGEPRWIATDETHPLIDPEEFWAMMRVRSQRATDAGLRRRPMAETVRDILADVG